MIVHVHVCTHNDEKILPYFIRHYGEFADKIFVYDNNSTDRTLEIAAGCPIMEVTQAPWGEGEWLDSTQGHFYEQQYKLLSRGVADWVIMLDSDEFIVHREGMREYLTRVKKDGRKVLRCQGWNMFSEEVPTGDGQIYHQVCLGQKTTLYSKVVVFDPSIDIVFGPGRHTTYMADASGELVEVRPRSSDRMKMLHYKYLSRDFSIRNGYYMNDPRFSSVAKERDDMKRQESIRRWMDGVSMLRRGELRDPMKFK
jgi:glycosyltransferase involved in cell wall biosynthesis